MKVFLTITMMTALATAAIAQPKSVSQATISTITNVIAPEEDEVASIQNTGQGGPGAMFRNFGDGETKATTYLKNDMVKTVIKSDMGRTTIIRDNASKLTTTLLEIMGKKTGFFITDEEQEGMKKKMDSMMQNRRKDSSATQRTISVTPNTASNVNIVYTEETKKIAGYVCKKAYVVSTHILGIKDSTVVWYTPELKLQNISSTGGLSGFGSMGGLNGLDKIDGFVMQYERAMPRGRKMTVEVTKLDLTKEIAAKEFDIPKDFEVKPMKEMQGMFGGPGGNRSGIQIQRLN
jgi:GLPGLI family protein